ncbi:MAG: hypothetical protein AAGJ10_08895 [Bacteroidota bacterium]
MRFSLFCTLLFAWTLLLPSTAQAQERPLARTSLYGQIGGDGVALSLNVDYMLNPRINVRAGLTTAFFANGLPLTVGYHLGQRQHRLEVGAGTFVVFSVEDDDFGDGDLPLWGMGYVGYRYHPRVRGLIWRVGAAVIADGESVAVLPGVALGQGLRFGL